MPLPSSVHDQVLIPGALHVVIYLHGFASSAQSGKATYLGQRLRERGVEFLAPDLNLPDFSTLTITRMIEQTRALIEAATGPVTLVGSSLGAFVAVNVAAKWPERVKNLVLLAPALDLRDLGGDQLDGWRRTGQLPVFHFGYGRILKVHYELYEDARRYDTVNAAVPMPILVFQGRRDIVVHPATVQAWCDRRPNAALHMLDDEHQLAGSLSYIWEKLQGFLSI